MTKIILLHLTTSKFAIKASKIAINTDHLVAISRHDYININTFDITFELSTGTTESFSFPTGEEAGQAFNALISWLLDKKTNSNIFNLQFTPDKQEPKKSDSEALN